MVVLGTGCVTELGLWDSSLRREGGRDKEKRLILDLGQETGELWVCLWVGQVLELVARDNGKAEVFTQKVG